MCAALALLLGAAAPQAAAPCAADRIDSWVEVRSHHDGDTLRLADGRKLRLIGLDTPELGREGKPDQPLAQQAKQALGELLAGSRRIGLRYDRERHDRYGRTLAHLYLEDGRSIAATLLEQGLATLLIVPPNTWNAPCLARRQGEAQTTGRGLWALPAYRPIDSQDLKGGQEGFRRVRGTVTRIGESRRSLWLNLDGPLALRLPKEALGEFAADDPRQWQGRTLIASGWLRYHKGQYRMTVRHPSAIEFITE